MHYDATEIFCLSSASKVMSSRATDPSLCEISFL